ncbi:hypothetical protein BD410DRAFT_240393 [Rickenella mellea]|uniref:Pentacotripeptide-repeat region of PRORP domain-containing protein n=1 Tax=Rickenella mellea TaxID=50990 RepID=A0A4Y7QN89_9AGAM|nr:hypothetical protein BD410DRAFT_240393 [Rickenella mellea]
MLARTSVTQTGLLDFLVPRLLIPTSATTRRPPRQHHANSKSFASTVLKGRSTPNKIAQSHDRVLEPQTTNVDPTRTITAQLASLRHAAYNGDHLRTWESCMKMEKDKLGHLLGPPEFKLISRLVESRTVEPFGTSVEWERNALHYLALTAATANEPIGLRALMMYYIKTRDAAAVIDLFMQYKNRLTAMQVIPDPSGVVERTRGTTRESNMAFFDVSNGVSWNDDIRDTIMLPVIAAYAILDSFEEALRLISDHLSVRLNAGNVGALLADLEYDQNLRRTVDGYIRDLITARLVASPEILSKHVGNISRDRSVSELQKLLESILSGFTEPRAWLARNTAEVSASKPFIMPQRSWAILLTALLHCRREDLAENLWSDLLDLGIEPSVTVWNALLEGYREMGALAKLMTTWETMVQSGISPDAMSYCAKLSTLFQLGEKVLALRAFESYKADVNLTNRELVVYNAVLHGLLINSDPLAAHTLLKTMSARGPKPDVISYNTFLRYYGRRGDIEKMSVILRALQDTGGRPDVHSFSTVISALYRTGKSSAVDGMRAVMKSMGVEENVATFTTMIDNQLREHTSAGIQVAFDVLALMEKDPNAQPNEVTYTALLAGLHRTRHLPAAEVSQKVREIAKRMQARGIRPNRVTYHILLKACLNNPNPEGLKSAKQYIHEMEWLRVPFSHDTWYIILRGLIERSEWSYAKEMVDRMRMVGFKPMWGVADMERRIREHVQ